MAVQDQFHSSKSGPTAVAAARAAAVAVATSAATSATAAVRTKLVVASSYC